MIRYTLVLQYGHVCVYIYKMKANRKIFNSMAEAVYEIVHYDPYAPMSTFSAHHLLYEIRWRSKTTSSVSISQEEKAPLDLILARAMSEYKKKNGAFSEVPACLLHTYHLFDALKRITSRVRRH